MKPEYIVLGLGREKSIKSEQVEETSCHEMIVPNE